MLVDAACLSWVTHGSATTLTVFAGTMSVVTMLAPRVTVMFAFWSDTFEITTAKVNVSGATLGVTTL